jgi:hypothetical protein
VMHSTWSPTNPTEGHFTNGRWTNPIRARRAAPVPEGTLRFLVTQAALALLCGTAMAENPKQADPAADAELLEFLGSVDPGADSQTADDGSWIDYLAQTDIGKVVKTTDPKDASGKQTATEAQPPAPGDKKDD